MNEFPVSLAGDDRQPNLLWMFSKIQKYEELKKSFEFIRKENRKLKQYSSQIKMSSGQQHGMCRYSQNARSSNVQDQSLIIF